MSIYLKDRYYLVIGLSLSLLLAAGLLLFAGQASATEGLEDRSGIITVGDLFVDGDGAVQLADQELATLDINFESEPVVVAAEIVEPIEVVENEKPKDKGGKGKKKGQN